MQSFDSICVEGLLYKLESVNLPHRLLCIISSFLSNRKGFIDINGHYTELFDFNVGLPQGRVISPLLFIFYLCDFLSEVEVKFKFADDSSAIISAFNTDTLHSALQAICHNVAFRDERFVEFEGFSGRVELTGTLFEGYFLY